jgi:hypothetical protein
VFHDNFCAHHRLAAHNLPSAARGPGRTHVANSNAGIPLVFAVFPSSSLRERSPGGRMRARPPEDFWIEIIRCWSHGLRLEPTRLRVDLGSKLGVNAEAVAKLLQELLLRL